MTQDEEIPDDPSLEAGRSAAQQLGTDWQLDGEEILESLVGATEESTDSPVVPVEPVVESSAINTAESKEEKPSSPAQILEAMLFMGGPPLQPATFCSVVRVKEEVFHQALDELNQRYQKQRRPYSIQRSGEGYLFRVRPAYRELAAKLTSGPRSTRLSQVALDVLSLVAYRQPVAKADIDVLRGGDSTSALRQLVRLGLISSSRRGEANGPCYTTTSRFLELFHLNSLEDLPRLGEAERMSPS